MGGASKGGGRARKDRVGGGELDGCIMHRVHSSICRWLVHIGEVVITLVVSRCRKPLL